MKLVLQRVRQASVAVDGQIVGQIAQGMLILLGVAMGDTEEKAAYLARKAAELRIFGDAQGKMNLSLVDIHGQALVVSQFTLAADVAKGKRPSFDTAAPPALAKELYEKFIYHLQSLQIPTTSGIFGAYMQVALVNDGPVTFLLER